MKEREPLSTEPYKGVEDYYPEDWARMQAVFDSVRTALRKYGYEEYQASPLERAEIYESKTSEEIVNEQTYTFTDRGERRVTLRPEMTPTLARMVAARRRELPFPLRWFSIGNRFRYERPQRGRQREFYQIDVDFVGLGDARAEGEIVVMAYEMLRALGAKDEDFTIRLNSRSLLNAACEAVGLSASEQQEYLALVDRKEKMSAGDFEARRAPFRKNGRDPLEEIEWQSDEAVAREYEKVENLRAAFVGRGMTNTVFDPTVVRGFLYYTGLVFEVFDTHPDNPRALLGGGRYDGLVALFGGEPIPAVGFAAGVTTLLDFLETHDLLPDSHAAPDIYIGTPGPDDIALAHEYADTLRSTGYSVFVNVTDRALGDQIRDASRRGIRFFIAYGSQESRSNIVRLKDLPATTEESLALNEVLEHLAKASRR